MSSVSYCDRVNISIARTYLLREFHFTDIQIGYIFTIFLIGYALFQAPGGRIADRYGPRRAITAYMVWFAIFVSLVTFIPSSLGAALLAFAAIRFLLGSGEAVLFPGSNRLVAKWIPSNERGIANGLIFAGVGAGAGMSPPLVTYIMLHGGWRLSFWLNAALGLLVGVVWYLLARDKPEDHP